MSTVEWEVGKWIYRAKDRTDTDTISVTMGKLGADRRIELEAGEDIVAMFKGLKTKDARIKELEFVARQQLTEIKGLGETIRQAHVGTKLLLEKNGGGS